VRCARPIGDGDAGWQTRRRAAIKPRRRAAATEGESTDSFLRAWYFLWAIYIFSIGPEYCQLAYIFEIGPLRFKGPVRGHSSNPPGRAHPCPCGRARCASRCGWQQDGTRDAAQRTCPHMRALRLRRPGGCPAPCWTGWHQVLDAT